MFIDKQQKILLIKSTTWQKDSYSLFDYEFNKNTSQKIFEIPISHKFVFLYRNNQSFQIQIQQIHQMIPIYFPNMQLLCCFQLKVHHKKVKIEFHHASQFKQFLRNKNILQNSDYNQTQNDLSKVQDIYLIVRSLKDKYNQNKGYKLRVGQFIKLGRVQYKIGSLKSSEDQKYNYIQDQINYSNPNIIKYSQENIKQEDLCKYCLEGEVTFEGYFFVSPCKCTGSSGLVHFNCLKKWIQPKVKKQVLPGSGTIHYNFELFRCQVCQEDFPRYIQHKQTIHELITIDRPQSSHLTLEEISDKTKNIILIKNTPLQGIKIGRSHQCQIRVQEASVSRNHAFIQKMDNNFILFDSKSKFGTLVKEEKLVFDLSKIKQGIQIGKTVLTFQLEKRQIRNIIQ